MKISLLGIILLFLSCDRNNIKPTLQIFSVNENVRFNSLINNEFVESKVKGGVPMLELIIDDTLTILYQFAEESPTPTARICHIKMKDVSNVNKYFFDNQCVVLCANTDNSSSGFVKNMNSRQIFYYDISRQENLLELTYEFSRVKSN